MPVFRMLRCLVDAVGLNFSRGILQRALVAGRLIPRSSEGANGDGPQPSVDQNIYCTILLSLPSQPGTRVAKYPLGRCKDCVRGNGRLNSLESIQKS